MAIEIEMPRLSSTMEEGLVATWRKRVGETVLQGEPLVDIETDKATIEVESPVSGVVAEIRASAGESVRVGTVIACIEELKTTSKTYEGELTQQLSKTKDSRVLSTPSARRLARELGVDLSRINGSGPGGRVQQRDVERFAEEVIGSVRKNPSYEEKSDRSRDVGASQAVSKGRRAVSDTVTASWQEIPQFWVEQWVDATELLHLYRTLRAAQREGAPKVTITDFLVQAFADALQECSELNVQLRTDGGVWRLEQLSTVSLGLVVDRGESVDIPVIEDVGGRTISEIRRKREQVVHQSRVGASSAKGRVAYSVSNIGPDLAERFRALVPPGQTGILALGSIAERVVPRNGSPAVRSGFYATMTFDHRVVDGKAGARLLQTFRRFVEDGRWNIV